MTAFIILLAAIPLLYLIGDFYYNALAWLNRAVTPMFRALRPMTKEGIIMAADESAEFATSGNGFNYDHSAAAASRIVRLHSDPSQPKEKRFGAILFEVLEKMEMAQAQAKKVREGTGKE